MYVCVLGGVPACSLVIIFDMLLGWVGVLYNERYMCYNTYAA